MSFTSSATVSRDWEVPSPKSFRNRLLLVTIARGDGTPLDASFISEEDIIEICIRQAHIHLLGVLQYSAMESVVFLQNIKDLNRILCTLPDVMEFHDEAVTVWIMAPAEAPLQPLSKCGTQIPLQVMEDHALLPNNHLSAKKHHIVSMHSLETLMIVSFNSSYKISLKRSCSID